MLAFGSQGEYFPFTAQSENQNVTHINEHMSIFHRYLFIERVEKHYCLYCLSETHLISQDGICSLSPGEPQPVQTLQLVWVQCSPSGVNVPWLVLKLDGWLVI